MLRVAIDDLVKEVRIALDENAEQSSYLNESVENQDLDAIIRAKLPEAARDVIDTAEVELLEPVAMQTTATANEWGGVLTVPADYLRFVSLEMKGWIRAVTALAAEGSDIELMQHNPYTRGSKSKPVCILSTDASGVKVIEYYGVSAEVEKALYMPMPKVVTEGGVDVLPIPSLLKQAIVKRAAGLTLLSRGEAERASVFLA